MFYEQLPGHASLSQNENQNAEGALEIFLIVPPHSWSLIEGFTLARPAKIVQGQHCFLSHFIGPKHI